MPIPEYKPDTPWVPEEWKQIYYSYDYYAAWYAGDIRKLEEVHKARAHPSTPSNAFWAREVKEGESTKLHVPIAADIAQASADLLFSEPPEVVIPAKTGSGVPGEEDLATEAEAKNTQARLDYIIERGEVFNRLVEAAETQSPMGGVFLKVVWDEDVLDVPVLAVVQPDLALPEFKWGVLQAVTFWKELPNINPRQDIVYRFLERHEKGVIYRALYRGTRSQLGIRVGLAEHPETESLEDEEVLPVEDLIVRYVPNMRPNRLLRGSSLGQSDLAGVEGLMDSLDEAFTSWMRDIRLAKARVIVPESWLEFNDQGQPYFDTDREIFTKLNIDPLTAGESGNAMTVAQFAIRMEEHRQTCLELIERIITHAGYSPQTFGLKIEGSSESGTALNLRERRSYITKSKKERYWTHALEDIFEIMLAVDAKVFGSNIKPFRPSVKLADALSFDLRQVAETINILNTAQAISIETKVRMAHPDWSEEQIREEVERIKEEQGLGTPIVEPSPLPSGQPDEEEEGEEQGEEGAEETPEELDPDLP